MLTKIGIGGYRDGISSSPSILDEQVLASRNSNSGSNLGSSFRDLSEHHRNLRGADQPLLFPTPNSIISALLAEPRHRDIWPFPCQNSNGGGSRAVCSLTRPNLVVASDRNVYSIPLLYIQSVSYPTQLRFRIMWLRR